MEKNFLVSAIITTRNRKELLEKAIKSVRNQTYSNIELLVIDDGSNDGTQEMLKKLDVKNIYIKPEESRGGNYARNLGIKNCNGKYVAFLDDDDEWLPEKIEKQLNVFKNNKDIGVVGCARIFEFNFKTRVKPSIKNMMEGDLSQLIFTEIPFTTSTLMINRELLMNNLFDENLKAWQEYELLIRLAKLTKFGVVKEFLLLYRVIDSDKKRITNNLDGWIESVEYIEKKHQATIKNLPIKIQKKHMALILKDGSKRADRVKNNKLKRRYLRNTLKYEFNFKNLVKFLLNKSKRRR